VYHPLLLDRTLDRRSFAGIGTYTWIDSQVLYGNAVVGALNQTIRCLFKPETDQRAGIRRVIDRGEAISEGEGQGSAKLAPGSGCPLGVAYTHIKYTPRSLNLRMAINEIVKIKSVVS
jgi:hypothetical protein